ncbi:MAG: hypothetical protein RLZZ450_5028, partial [Pseudomonadota bacterium]
MNVLNESLLMQRATSDHRRRRVDVRTWLASLWIALLVVGCQAPIDATEIVVEHGTDLVVGVEIKQLRIRIFDPKTKLQLVERELEVTAQPAPAMDGGVYGAPYRLAYSLTPMRGVHDVRVVVTARGPIEENGPLVDVVENSAVTSFRPGQRLLLSLFLGRKCFGHLCRDPRVMRDLTCEPGQGTCQPVVPVDLKPSPDVPVPPVVSMPEPATATKVECSSDVDCAPVLAKAVPSGCAVARCSDDKCMYQAVDADDDGHTVESCRLLDVPQVGDVALAGDDCDDTNSSRYRGAWDGPGVGALANRCDNIDDDCNGVADDAALNGKGCMCNDATDVNVECSLLPGAEQTVIVWPAGKPIGACRTGTRSCKDGEWLSCEGARAPLAADSCDVADDDSNCNGVRSEGCECINGSVRPCGVAIGACKPGTQTCVDAKWSSECVGAVRSAPADTCDAGNDASCDGLPNQGCACINGTTSTCGKELPGAGDCLNKAITCTNGAWPLAACQENCPDCPSGACGNGLCVDGRGTYRCTCNAGFSGSEDGTTCSSVDLCRDVKCAANSACVDGRCACRAGFTALADGSCVDACAGKNCGPGGTCRAGACSCAVGYKLTAGVCVAEVIDRCVGVNCAPGSCNDGTCVCPASHRAAGTSCVDRCTGLDCRPGSCSNGACVCPSGFVAENGRCLCPAGTMEQSGSCVRATCVGFNCAPGQCSNDACACPAGYKVQGRTCVSVCTGVNCGLGMCNASTGQCSCASPLVAQNGTCTCPTPYVAQGGMCVCASPNYLRNGSCVPCGSPRVLQNGQCVCPPPNVTRDDGTCGPAPYVCSAANCASPSTCVNNVCTPFTCNATTCASPSTCVNNVCTPFTCNATTCASPSTCVNNVCTPFTCNATTCASPSTCVNNVCTPFTCNATTCASPST